MTRVLLSLAAGAAVLSAATAAAQEATADGSHPSVRVGEPLRIEFRAQVQLDARRSEAALTERDTVPLDVARRRVGLHGAWGKRFAFQVESELANDDPWRDIYLDYRVSRALSIQGGQFKLPFSLDENTASARLPFAYRSRAATQLAPGRDQGVMIHGRVWRRLLKYEAGAFLHDGSNARLKRDGSTSGGRTAALRLTTFPLAASRSPLADVQAALAFTRSTVPEGVSGIRGRTVLDMSFFPSTLWVSGTRRRIGVEARWRPGPFSLAAEYIRVMDERRAQATTGDDLPPLAGVGWYVAGTWGRPRQTGRAYGAFELAARIESLRFGDIRAAASPSPRAERVPRHSDRAITLGANWYVHRWLKLQANVIHETIGRGARRDGSFWSHVARLQFIL